MSWTLAKLLQLYRSRVTARSLFKRITQNGLWRRVRVMVSGFVLVIRIVSWAKTSVVVVPCAWWTMPCMMFFPAASAYSVVIFGTRQLALRVKNVLKVRRHASSAMQTARVGAVRERRASTTAILRIQTARYHRQEQKNENKLFFPPCELHVYHASFHFRISRRRRAGRIPGSVYPTRFIYIENIEGKKE